MEITKRFNKRLINLFMMTLIYTNYVEADENEIDVDDKVLRESVLSRSDSIKHGEKKFNALCAYCHGNAGSGGKAKKLQGRQLQADYIFNIITNGKKQGSLNMPPWPKLPKVVRWQLVSYILSLSEINE